MTKITLITEVSGSQNTFALDIPGAEEKAIPCYRFFSQKMYIKEGEEFFEWEILIDKNHPLFANLKPKFDGIHFYPYEITFDSEQGVVLNTLGKAEKGKYFGSQDSIAIVEKNSNEKRKKRYRTRRKELSDKNRQKTNGNIIVLTVLGVLLIVVIGWFIWQGKKKIKFKPS